MMANKLRIEMTDHGRGSVYLDDVEVPDVMHVNLSCSAGGLNRAEINVTARVVEMQGPADVKTSHKFVRIVRPPTRAKQCSYPNEYFSGGLR